MASCSPVTARPDFTPLPEAPVALLLAPPARVITVLAQWLAADSLGMGVGVGVGVGVKRASPVDGYLETEWYDTRTHRSYTGDRMPDLAHTIKLRCWADPYTPGETMLTIEAAYRPRYDPSRTERDLERLVPKDSAGARLAATLLERLTKRFGSPKPGS